jgi:hypothetical protein
MIAFHTNFGEIFFIIWILSYTLLLVYKGEWWYSHLQRDQLK